jgi:hypothetical protein
MARYKLWVPDAGDYLYGGDGAAYVADDIREARDLLERFEVHSYIGSPRVLYKHDVENDFCFEGAEPGDTQVDYLHDDGRDLRENECRVWMAGPPRFSWSLSPLQPDPIHPQEVPVGCSIHVAGFGSTRTTKVPWEEDERWLTEVALWPHFDHKRTVCLTAEEVCILPTGDWPEVRHELTVEGETAVGSKDEMEALRRWAVSALEDEWRRSLPPARESAEVPT